MLKVYGLRRYNIFVDLDGVLANFEKLFGEETGFIFNLLEISQGADYAWEKIRTIPDFWYRLELMPGAEVLWNFLKPYSPIILTAPSSRDMERAKVQKRLWVDKMFGADVPVLFRQGKFKSDLAAPDSILIDDHKPNTDEFKRLGGNGIHHRSVDETLETLTIDVFWKFDEPVKVKYER